MRLFKKMGQMDDFELKSSIPVFLLIAPCQYLYSMFIAYFSPERLELDGARELFSLLFLIVGFLPLFFKPWSRKYYGHLVFFSLFIFAHYLIYTTALNNFSLDYMLGSYIVLFGGILLLAHGSYIIIFTATAFAHTFYRLLNVDLPQGEESAIALSLATIFLFSIFIQNGFLTHKQKLKLQNSDLEKKIKSRTKDLERRARELAIKNKELEDFAYVVSHDMKSPLRNVHSLGSWVAEDMRDARYAQAQMNLDLLMEQVAQMDMLVDGVLKYSLGIEKKTATELLDMNTLVDNLIKANSSDSVVIEKDSALPRIFMDKAQLLQVFQNLLGNAIKYNDKPIAYINIGVIDEVDRFKFYVQDNGMGIAASHYDRIFKLFQKLNPKEDETSSGIGLAVVKKIIGKNGGEVGVASQEGYGSTFSFTLYKEDVLDNFGAKKTDKELVVHS